MFALIFFIRDRLLCPQIATTHNIIIIKFENLPIALSNSLRMVDADKFSGKFSPLLRILFLITEAVVQRFSVKKVFSEIPQNSQENTSARVSFLIKKKDFMKKEALAQVFL